MGARGYIGLHILSCTERSRIDECACLSRRHRRGQNAKCPAILKLDIGKGGALRALLQALRADRTKSDG